MKVLVTGASGFMGNWLAEHLSKPIYHDSIEVARTDVDASIDDLLEKNFWEGDLRNTKFVNEVVQAEKPEVIYHLAAYAAEGQSVFSPIEINDINIKSMNNLLVAAVNNDVKRIVFTSSMAVYGIGTPPFHEEQPRKPVDPYGIGKAYCEEMLEAFWELHGLEYTIIRPHNVYGPRQNTADPYRNVIGIWMNRALRGLPPIIYGDGSQKRAFSYIEDITPPLAEAGFRPIAKNEIINLGGSIPYSINQVFSWMKPIVHCEDAIYMPSRKGEVKEAWCTTEKSKKLLNYWERNDIMTGLNKMWQWVKTIGPQEPTYKVPLEIKKGAPEVWIKKEM